MRDSFHMNSGRWNRSIVTTGLTNGALYAYMTGFLLLCSSYSIITKYQDTTYGHIPGQLFSHPYWQTFVTAVGESLALVIYFSKKRNNKRYIDVGEHVPVTLEEETKTIDGIDRGSQLITKKEVSFKFYKLSFPALLSNSETLFKCIATLLIPASTVQMLSGTSILFSAMLTVLYLKV